MKIKTKSRITVFILSFLCWIALTDIKDIQEIIVGIIASVLVSLFAGHMLVTTEKTHNIFRRSIAAVVYLFKFVWEMIKANFHVAYLVLHPLMPIKPGIVKIKTGLTKDSALMLLTNSITLTPGTLTIDINKNRNEIYVHWIDTVTTDIDKATDMIGSRFEKQLREVFE